MDETGGATSKATEAPIALPGGFISLPGAFPDARPELRHLLKLWYRPTIREVEDGSVVAGLEVSTDAMLVDFSGVTADSLDPKSIAADCDFVKGIVTKFPDAGTADAPGDAARDAGGCRAGGEDRRRDRVHGERGRQGRRRLFFLIVVVAVAAGAGCGGALKQKATSPAATTTPKPPPQPQ